MLNNYEVCRRYTKCAELTQEVPMASTEAKHTGSTPVPDRPKHVTLQDVARAAGVNMTTASDALKGTGRVSAKTREKVQRIAAEHNYVPNFAARALATGRTHTVVMIGGSLQESYYVSVAHSLEDVMATDGYKLMLMRTSREVRESVIATQSFAVDGIIAVDKYQLVDAYQGSRPSRPCVFIGTYSPELVDSVTVDLSVAVRQALTYMMDGGCKRIAYVVTSGIMAGSDEVRSGTYLSTMQAAGRQSEIIDLHASIEEVTERFKAYVRTHGHPDAILCQNDDTAISVYRGLLDLGYRVPRDVLLVGCDGLRHMECFETPLSTIVQPIQEVCALAWQFLKNRIANPDLPPQQTILQAHLVIRESLRPPLT